MKLIKINGADIKVPKGKAFAYETPPQCPKGHMLSLAVGKRGAGKSTAIVNLIRMLNYDRILVISPTFKSNSALMKELDIDSDDVFEDPDDVSVIRQIQDIIEEERDELEIYLEKKKEYNRLLKMLADNYGQIPDELLMEFYENGNFEPPTHKYNGRNPFICVLIDDCQNSKLFTKKHVSNMAIKHRHLGAFETDRPSIGISMFFLLQNYKSQGGGACPRSIRNNCTNCLIFKNKDTKEMDFISTEMAGEVDKETFMKAYDIAMADGEHPFLFVDLHKKENHQSMFRSRFDKFIMI